MTATLIAISAAYVVMGMLLLSVGLTSPLRWWVKAAAIVLTSAFFVESFFATRGLLGWPGSGRLPARFQLLWTRVVEPDPKIHDAGSIFLWVEEVDENNVPTGTPRSYRLPYTKPLADRSLKARDEIMSGNPQEGTAEDLADNETPPGAMANLPENSTLNQAPLANNIDLSQLQALQQTQVVEFKPMSGPLLPAKQ
ncbi:MAG TPA: hypothetical protein VGI22_01235 [Xanthobacteraceae bacterium]|jgi:hypothetical protein